MYNVVSVDFEMTLDIIWGVVYMCIKRKKYAIESNATQHLAVFVRRYQNDSMVLYLLI